MVVVAGVVVVIEVIEVVVVVEVVLGGGHARQQPVGRWRHDLGPREEEQVVELGHVARQRLRIVVVVVVVVGCYTDTGTDTDTETDRVFVVAIRSHFG